MIDSNPCNYDDDLRFGKISVPTLKNLTNKFSDNKYEFLIKSWQKRID